MILSGCSIEIITESRNTIEYVKVSIARMYLMYGQAFCKFMYQNCQIVKVYTHMKNILMSYPI